MRFTCRGPAGGFAAKRAVFAPNGSQVFHVRHLVRNLRINLFCGCGFAAVGSSVPCSVRAAGLSPRFIRRGISFPGGASASGRKHGCWCLEFFWSLALGFWCFAPQVNCPGLPSTGMPPVPLPWFEPSSCPLSPDYKHAEKYPG